MDRELLHALYDALEYADKSLKRIIDGEAFTRVPATSPIRLLIEGLSKLISELVEHLVRSM